MRAQLEQARAQIVFARNYTLRFLDQLSDDDWFRQPPGGVTHIAWQVGHVAMAEYRLAIERMRGRLPEDEGLMSDAFLLQFGKGSVPDPDPAKYPPVEKIRAVFDGVHQRALEVTAELSDSDLASDVLRPHPLVKSKLQALFYCPLHEMLHAGQIALVRRLLGRPPVW